MEINNELKDNKDIVVDYLSNGSPIFQSKKLYTFTSDSIELAKSVKNSNINILVDLCAGSGIVGLEVMAQKNVNKLYLVEVQTSLAELAKLTVDQNTEREKIVVLNIDAINSPSVIGLGLVDVVTINPPYFKKGSGKISSNKVRAIARMEDNVLLHDFIEVAKKLLKPGGELYMVHIYDRLVEIKNELATQGFILMEEKVLNGKLKRVIIHAKKQ